MFDEMLKAAANLKGVSATGSGGALPFLDLREGSRRIRLLPNPANPEQPMMGPVVLEAWVTLKRGEKEIRRPIFVDESTRKLLPAAVAESVKLQAFINVFDKTLVVRRENGVVYPNAVNQYVVEGKELSERPARRNEIVVLKGSVSQRGGRGLFNDLDDLSRTTFDEDTGKLIPLSTVDLQIKTVGQGLLTKRTITVHSADRNPLPENALDAGVYDLYTYCKPWPADAVRAVVAGEDYDTIVKEYSIPVVPLLQPIARPAAVQAAVVGQVVVADELF
jgi:hypothetical protein